MSLTIFGFQCSSEIIYAVAIIFLTTIFTIYRYVTKFSFWSNQGVPGPNRAIPLLGNQYEIIFKSNLNVLIERWKKFGPVYGFYVGTKPQLVIGDPDMLKDALIKDWYVFMERVGADFPDGNPHVDKQLGALRGDEWKNMRSVISPTFTSRKMKHMFNIMNECCKLLIGCIKKKIDGGGASDGLDMRIISGCYSMDVIAKCCFGVSTNSFDDPNDPFVKHCKGFFMVPVWKIFFKILVPSFVRKLVGFTQSPINAINFLAHASKTVIKQRLKMGDKIKKKDYDYLQLLIEASKDPNSDENENLSDVNENGPDSESHHGYDNEIQVSKKRPLTNDEVVANAVTFLAVGYDTTSLLISFTIYNLAMDLNVQEKLHSELESIVLSNGKFDYESITGNKYLDAVISETLRLFPPAVWIERKCGQDYTFKKNGIMIPKGGSIWQPIYNLHHEPKFWPNPEKFDPSRFLPENRHNIVPYTYLPFGAGPRNCVGMRFALLEAKLGIANLCLNFKFSPCCKTDIPPDCANSSFLLTPKTVIVNIEKRTK